VAGPNSTLARTANRSDGSASGRDTSLGASLTLRALREVAEQEEQPGGQGIS